MRIPISAEKAKEIEAYAARIDELLRTAKALDDAVIPDSVKNLSLGELEGTPVRVKNMLNNIVVCTLWELVHFDMAKCRKYRGGFFTSKHRMSELMYAIKEAIDLLRAPQIDSNKKAGRMSGIKPMSVEEQNNLSRALEVALAVLKEEEVDSGM